MITQFFPGRFFSSKDLCSAFNNFLDVEEYRALTLAVLSQKLESSRFIVSKSLCFYPL